MAPLSRETLVAGFIGEVKGYLPLIRDDLARARDGSNGEVVLEQAFRLFHNIKGAAAQLSLPYLSGAARVAEDLLEGAVYGKSTPAPAVLDFLERTAGGIHDLCCGAIREEEAGRRLLRETVADWRALAAGGAGASEREIEHDMDLLCAGQSIVNSKSATAELDDSVQRAYECVALLGDAAGTGDSGPAGAASHLAGLGATIRTAATLAKRYGNDQAADFAGSLGAFVDWLGAGSDLADGQMAGLLEDYLGFYEILLKNPGQVGQGRVESIAGTMQRVRSLSGSLQPDDTADFPTLFDEIDLFAGGETLDGLADFGDESPLFHPFDALAADDLASPLPPEAAGDISDREEMPAEDEMDLHDIFLAECEEHLLVIGRALVALEQQVDRPVTATGTIGHYLGEMRRAVHTLKGAAGMTGFQQLSDFAHKCEDLLDSFFAADAEINPAEIVILAAAIDLIEFMATGPDRVDVHRVAELEAAIEAALRPEKAPGPAEGPEGDPAAERDAAANAAITSAPGTESADAGGEPAAMPVPARQNEEDPAAAAPSAENANVRVRLDNLDELVSIEDELIIARNSMERGLDELSRTIGELNLAKDRLRGLATELETGFEVESLYGFGSGQAVLPAAKGATRGETEFADFDPLELDRYSQLSLIIRSLNELSVDVGSIHLGMTGLSSELHGHVARQQLLMNVMQDKLMQVRMTPMSSLSRGFFRAVRGAAERLGKRVRLSIEGEDVYLDRYIWTRVTDPIMHILRNAVDHGIEAADDREAAGKPATAHIRLKAVQRGRHVILEISDDGQGIDCAAIREKLQHKGLVRNPADLTEQQVLEYLFVPGFSTREEISQISGRGVGLDVARKNLQELKGSVRVHARVGEGTTFELRIPVTLSVNRAVIVTVGSEKYAVPLHDILEIRKVPGSEVIGGDELQIRIGETVVPLKDLAALAGLRPGPAPEHRNGGDIVVLVVPDEKDRVALIIDGIVDQQEIIIKSLGSHLKQVRGISGATIMGDGSLIPILNTRELVDSLVAPPVFQTPAEPDRVTAARKVLIVDDSVSVRQSVSRLVKSRGWQPKLATDGVDALEKIDEFMPDIIVLDIEMPRMNGFEFMGVLRNAERHRSVPVIMLTSRASEKHRRKAEEIGVDHYVIKPYKEEQFVALLKGVLGR